MSEETLTSCEREYDFALIASGVHELSDEVMDALFAAGCDDATPSIQYGVLYLDFDRSAKSLEQAITTAIRDVHKAQIGAEILRVDECDLVTQSDIARRINRSRELIRQYITGQCGPGGFPPPECHLTDRQPLWAWCSVSFWLMQHNLLPRQAYWEAEVIAAINNSLEASRQRKRHPELVETVNRDLQLA